MNISSNELALFIVKRKKKSHGHGDEQKNCPLKMLLIVLA